MARFTLTHDIDCDVDRFWTLFWDRDVSAKTFAHLGFPRWEIVDQHETDTSIVRVVEAVPKLDMPGPVAKVLGPGFGYTERGRFDKASRVFSFVIEPSTLKGKLLNEGTVRAEPNGDKTRRVVEVVAEAKVFGIGKMLESMTEKSFREGWGKGAEFLNDHLRKNP